MATPHFVRPIDRVRARAQRLAIRARYAATSGTPGKRDGGLFDTGALDRDVDQLAELVGLPSKLFRRRGVGR